MKKSLLILLFPVLVFGQTSFDRVELLFQQKKFGEAEEQTVQILKSEPNNIKAIELLGDAYSHQKKWDEALVQFKKLVEFDSKNANYHYKYGGILGMKALENKFKSIGFIGDIKSSFLKAAELDKNHIDVRWALVELYMLLPGIFGGSKTKALEFAQELEALSKVDGYLAKGYIYEYDKEPGLAEKYYKMAIVEGESLVCYDKLTKFYVAQNEPEKAIANLKDAYNKHQHEVLLLQIEHIKENQR